MKIRNVSKDNMAGLGISDREGKPLVDQVQLPFGDQLYKVQRDMVQQKLESLFADIEKQGRSLGESLNLKDLKKYKDLIQKFLDYAVNKMYHLKEQPGWDRKGRYKIYTTIETVNKELEDLTGMLMSDQKDQISILAKVDEIRGLLVDIFS
ncbi:MAG: YaaR family protein [Eubacteriales bacterium]